MILIILEMYKIQLEEILNSGDRPPVIGAYVTALNKATKREYICDLISEDMQTLDVTPIAAMQLIQRVLGRGVSNKFLLEKFGTPERTAADKSDIFGLDLAEYEKEINAKMKVLDERMKVINEQLRFEMRSK